MWSLAGVLLIASASLLTTKIQCETTDLQGYHSNLPKHLHPFPEQQDPLSPHEFPKYSISSHFDVQRRKLHQLEYKGLNGNGVETDSSSLNDPSRPEAHSAELSSDIEAISTPLTPANALSIFLPLPFNNKFVTSALDDDISFTSLETVNLRRLPRGQLGECIPVKWGGTIELNFGPFHSSEVEVKCSSYWQCHSSLSQVSACLDNDLFDPKAVGSSPDEQVNAGDPMAGSIQVMYDEYRGGMLALSNVFTNHRAQTFTKTRMYEKGGCSERVPWLFMAKRGMEVREFTVAVSLMHGAGNFYHSLIEVLPRFVLALPTLRALKGVPVLVSRGDVPFMGLLSLVGLRDFYKSLNIHVIGPQVLVRAQTLLVPFSPPCGQASRASWHVIRERHMGFTLPPVGVSPFPAPDRSSRWIVIGQRKGTRVLVEFDEVHKRLVREYGAERVRVFGDRRWTPREAFDLFRNAALYIAPHGAGLSNMVFMPAGASVVEIRPMRYSNPCYHFLADAMNHAYFRIDVDGTKSANLSVNVPLAMTIISSAAALSL